MRLVPGELFTDELHAGRVGNVHQLAPPHGVR
jgi:hypothetical protein